MHDGISKYIKWTVGYFLYSSIGLLLLVDVFRYLFIDLFFNHMQ